jgi:hypothetical protein
MSRHLGATAVDVSSCGGPMFPDFPTSLVRCVHCNRPGARRWEIDGRMVDLHFSCREVWAEEQDRATTNTRM